MSRRSEEGASSLYSKIMESILSCGVTLRLIQRFTKDQSPASSPSLESKFDI